jgi:uncharacterized protein YbdZ (MbtH family)
LFERQQHSLWPRSMTLIFLGWQSQSHHSGRRLSAADTCFNHSWTRDASPPFPHLTPTSIIRHISLLCFFFIFLALAGCLLSINFDESVGNGLELCGWRRQ